MSVRAKTLLFLNFKILTKSGKSFRKIDRELLLNYSL